MLSVQSNKWRRESRYIMLPLNKWTFTFVNLMNRSTTFPRHTSSNSRLIYLSPQYKINYSLLYSHITYIELIIIYIQRKCNAFQYRNRSSSHHKLVYNNKILLIKSYEMNLCIYLCGIIESSATETTQSTQKRTLTVVSDARCWFFI